MALNPEILGRPLFPSAQRTGELLRGVGRSVMGAFTPSAGTPPATMAGVSIPPAGASFGQLQFTGPLINTSRFNQQAAPQPAQQLQPARQPYNYGLFAATAGLPSFDATKTQTPFNQYAATAQQQISSALAMPPSSQAQAPTPAPILPTVATGYEGRTPLRIQGVGLASEKQGTIYATPEQQQNLAARTTAYEGRTPAQQQALLAQIKSRGPAIAQQRIREQEQYFGQKRAERESVRLAEDAARAAGVRPLDIMKASAAASAPSTIEGIQKEFASYQPRVGPMAPTSLYAIQAKSKFTNALPIGGSRPIPSTSMGLSGYALYEQQQASRRAAGIVGPYSNRSAEQRRDTREMAISRGIPVATNLQMQQAQEDYFRRK